MTKRYYVYIDNAIVGYVHATSFDNECAFGRGAMQKARETFGHNVDVVDSRNRMCNVAFERVSDTIFKRIGYANVRITTKQGSRERNVKGYDVRTNTST